MCCFVSQAARLQRVDGCVSKVKRVTDAGQIVVALHDTIDYVITRGIASLSLARLDVLEIKSPPQNRPPVVTQLTIGQRNGFQCSILTSPTHTGDGHPLRNEHSCCRISYIVSRRLPGAPSMNIPENALQLVTSYLYRSSKYWYLFCSKTKRNIYIQHRIGVKPDYIKT